MRISKKFAGHNIGKHTFVRKSVGFLSPVSISSMPYFYTASSSSGSPQHYTKSPRDPRVMEYYYSSPSSFSHDDEHCGSLDDEYITPQKRPRSDSSTSVSEAADWKDVLLFYCGNTFVGSNPVVKHERTHSTSSSSSSPSASSDFDAVNRCRVDSISEEFDSPDNQFGDDDEDLALLLDL
jgi:hypothetical protein